MKRIRIGHRGACGYLPENTIASYERAIQLGADIVECDVRLSKDRIPMIMHDETLLRTVGVSGSIGDYTLSELKNFRIEKKYEIPTLEEYLAVCKGRAGMAIELKEKSLPEIMQTLANTPMDDLYFISFEPHLITEAKGYGVRTGYLTTRCSKDEIKRCIDLGADGILPFHDRLTLEEVANAQASGLFIFTWLVNSKERADEMWNIGVDGIASDMPDILL